MNGPVAPDLLRWECAIVNLRSEAAKGFFDRTEAIYFGRKQDAGLVGWWKKHLGDGIKEYESNPQFLHLNMGKTNLHSIMALLGETGREMCGIQAGNVFFKRPVPVAAASAE